MWMQYSYQKFPVVEDLNSAISELCHLLYTLSMDALHATNYDMSICFDEEESALCQQKSERYAEGANICNRFTNGLINIEEFCGLMTTNHLKSFLYRIKKYLPKHIIENLFDGEVSDDEEEEDEENEEEDEKEENGDKVVAAEKASITSQ